VLLAIGRGPALAQTAVRFTLGAPTTEAEIEEVLERLPAALRRVRERTGSARAGRP
jgi:cysteine sulfinate desulfinase/cysteine desulfurase-like protein